MSRVASTWSPAEAAEYEVQLSLRLSQADAATRREHYRRLAVREQARGISGHSAGYQRCVRQ